MPRADMSRAWKERPISTFFATGGGVGMIPFAPGTWGSLEGIAVWYAAALGAAYWEYPYYPELPMRTIKHGTRWVSTTICFEPLDAVFVLPVLIGVLAVLLFLGVVVSGRAEQLSGKDPGAVVIDEVAGQYLALGLPVSLGLRTNSPWLIVLASFILFRLFDIWKPGPIRKLQDLPGGWGIMLDDVAAGILAGVITYGIGRAL